MKAPRSLAILKNVRPLYLYVGGVLIALLLAGGLLVLATQGPGLPTRTRSQLARALINTKNNTGLPTQRVAKDPAHSALVSDAEVTWYDQAGHEFLTPTESAADINSLFDLEAYTNYSEGSASTGFSLLASILIPLLLVGLLVYAIFALRRPNLFGKSNPRRITPKMVSETFHDVAGQDSAILELGELVAALRDPDQFTALGARIPKGVLIEGPPGTGKTLLSRAVAGEAKVPFYAVSGSEFVEMYVGIGASRVRDLFAKASTHPASIVYIDEIDAVGKRRSGGTQPNDEREQTLNQLLVEMDGIAPHHAVIVLASTNRADILDPALLRPGRFDRRLTLEYPDKKGRLAVLQIHARHKPLDSSVDLNVLAQQTPGFTGADLENLLNEGAILAGREKRKVILMTDLESAVLRVIAGPTRSSILSPKEREVIAYHELGHTLVGMTLLYADPVHRVSIVSRGRALGFTMQMAEQDQLLANRHQLADKLAGLLGGRAAEELVFGKELVTSGASNDIERASVLARTMVTELGMSPLGLRHFRPAEPGEPQTYSEATAEAIDFEIDRLLDEAANRARDLLAQRRPLLDLLAARLLEVETMDADELMAFVAKADPHTSPLAVISDRRRLQPILTPLPVEQIPLPAKNPVRPIPRRRWRDAAAAAFGRRVYNQ